MEFWSSPDKNSINSKKETAQETRGSRISQNYDQPNYPSIQHEWGPHISQKQAYGAVLIVAHFKGYVQSYEKGAHILVLYVCWWKGSNLWLRFESSTASFSWNAINTIDNIKEDFVSD